MTTIVKAATAAEFLSLVPSMLGYHPVRSLVLIPFAGSRTVGAMRFDLPESDDARDLDAFASTVVGMVCRVADADALVSIAYTDETFAEGGGMPHADLAAALERRAEACGLRTSDALCVAADGWGSYVDPECPASGRRLDELRIVEPEGLPAAVGDQASGSDLPDIDLAERERVGRALASLADALSLLCGAEQARAEGAEGLPADVDRPVLDGDPGTEPRVDPLALAAACALDDLPALFEDVLEWDADALPPLDAASLIWCLSRPALRDIALVQWCGSITDGDEAFDAQLKWEAGEEYPAHLAMHMWGEGATPDPERLQTALRLARRVAAAAPRASRTGPLATCAWLAWALGRSTHAERYALLACEIEPEHGLSEIVRSFVHAGHLPDWAFDRRSGRAATT
jgi:hypothetical protein